MIDLDGTLIDTAPEIARAANTMLTSLGQQALATKQIEAYIGEGAGVLVKRCLAGEPETELFVEAQQLFFEHYAQIAVESKPYAGALEAVQALQMAGYQLACVTNKSANFTLPLLEVNALLPYFDLVVSGDTLQRKKPAPDQIFYTCEKFGVPVSEALLIGDSGTDIAAARSAGCYVFTVPYGYNQGREIAASSVDAIISNLSEVLHLIH